jgi:hypothetical protein
MSQLDKQLAFTAAVLVALWLAGGTGVSALTGDWRWLGSAVLSLGVAGLVIGAVIAVMALAERVFPDSKSK